MYIKKNCKLFVILPNYVEILMIQALHINKYFNSLDVIQKRYKVSTPINTVILFVPQQEVNKNGI